VALGMVSADIVAPILGSNIDFIENPTVEDLRVAAGAIVRASVKVDRDLINGMPKLQVIARTGVGTDLVDLIAATERGIPVVITPGANTRAVAEGTFAHILHLVKRLGPLTSLIRSGGWEKRTNYLVGDLYEQTLGLIGYGRIGRQVGEFARAFGMKVIAYDPYAPPSAELRIDDLFELASRSDVISLHVPLTSQTHQLINLKVLDYMKEGTVLVNCGRGALIDLDDALVALRSGKLGGLGLDVFDPEPAIHHDIFDHENVVLTPHVMGLSKQATEATFIEAAQGVTDFLQGRFLKAVANPDFSRELILHLTKQSREH
jgi:D-3-phosphoglycerate dehydrogenase